MHWAWEQDSSPEEVGVLATSCVSVSRKIFLNSEQAHCSMCEEASCSRQLRAFAGRRGNCHPASGPGRQGEALWRAEEEAGPVRLGGPEAEPVQELARRAGL